MADRKSHPAPRSYLFSPLTKRIVWLYIFFLAVLSGMGYPYIEGQAYLPKSFPTPAVPHTQIEQVKVIEQIKKSTPPAKISPAEWGIAKQIDEHTWTMQIGEDKKMGTPGEILDALNLYRQRHGRGTVQWDDGLAAYAKTRTDFFTAKGTLDGHAGFSAFVNNEDGFQKLGFGALGENSSIGYTMEGVHLIEWVYAADKPHNDNQLDSHWTHVGIGVTGTASNLIFGAEKL